VTSSWFFLSTLNYDARSTTHQIYGLVCICVSYCKLRFVIDNQQANRFISLTYCMERYNQLYLKVCLRFVRLVKKFPAFYGTRRFITAFL